jgi:hypothetical protein
LWRGRGFTVNSLQLTAKSRKVSPGGKLQGFGNATVQKAEEKDNAETPSSQRDAEKAEEKSPPQR